MQSWKDFLANKFDKLCKSSGVDPWLLIIFIMLLQSIWKFKHIKKWKELTPSERRSDILWWLLLAMIAIGYIVKSIRGY